MEEKENKPTCKDFAEYLKKCTEAYAKHGSRELTDSDGEYQEMCIRDRYKTAKNEAPFYVLTVDQLAKKLGIEIAEPKDRKKKVASILKKMNACLLYTSGVSLITLRQFENGKAYNINMGNFLALLRVVDCLEEVDDLLPEIPVSALSLIHI